MKKKKENKKQGGSVRKMCNLKRLKMFSTVTILIFTIQFILPHYLYSQKIIEGEIIGIIKDKEAMIDIGEKDGLKIGDELKLKRVDKIIGIVKVKEVKETYAIIYPLDERIEFDLKDVVIFLPVVEEEKPQEEEVIKEEPAIKEFPQVELYPLKSNILNTPTVQLMGKAEGNQSKIINVEYSVDNGKTWRSATPTDGKFDSLKEEFTIALQLKDDKYKILARAQNEAGNISEKYATSEFVIDTEPPLLIIGKPVSGMILETDKVVIAGKVEQDAKVNIDGKEVVVSPTNEFEKEILLKKGKNIITVVAEDKAGNKTEKKLVLNYSPPTKDKKKLTRYLLIGAGAVAVIALLMGGRKEKNQEVEKATGMINISSNPQNAKIFINGKDTGKVSPTTVTVPVGTHIVKLKKEGYAEVEKTVNVEKDKTYELFITLLPDPTVTQPPSPPTF